MKFGAHCYLFTDHWSDDSLDILDRARGLGLDCLEIAVGDDVRFTPAPLRQRAAGLGMDLVLSPGGQWPDCHDVSSDDAGERRGALEWHRRWIDLAGDLNAVAYTGALYGHPGTVRRRRPPPDEARWVADGLRQLAEHGADRGVTLAIEPMSHFRSHLVNTPDQAMRLVDLADHPNLRILLDTYHMVTEVTDYHAAILTAAPRLWGLHACENNRGAPGTGIIPWQDVFRGLREGGFDGYLILETYNSAIGEFARQRGMFHNVCPDPDDFTRRSLEFLRSGLTVVSV